MKWSQYENLQLEVGSGQANQLTGSANMFKIDLMCPYNTVQGQEERF